MGACFAPAAHLLLQLLAAGSADEARWDGHDANAEELQQLGEDLARPSVDNDDRPFERRLNCWIQDENDTRMGF